ncbi:MAG: AAC(3) family N-acetyltransferase, partial [Acidimicrobiales bacterium]|nr:AAC(3) family N-acetyltransferase [Acidimicrobiales bacterium]
LGQDGTLVVPTFTYPADYPDSRNSNWIFDPAVTHSGMGAITNAVRTRPGALRSLHLWHSVAAIGPLAKQITTAGGTSAWDAESPMAWVFNNGGRLLLLGVPYQNLTAIHIWEVEFGVDYRNEFDVERRMRRQDGNLVPLISRVHDRVNTHPGSDFNRFGERMEATGKVQIGQVGNAVARLFSARDASEIAKTMYAEDKRAFLKQGDPITSLSYGRTIQNNKGTQCVVDSEQVFPTLQPNRPHEE